MSIRPNGPTATATPRKRKPNTNLRLSQESRRQGKQLCRYHHRRSLTNLVEHLIIEAHRQAFGKPREDTRPTEAEELQRKRELEEWRLQRG